jgi:predicted AAA+ superfamily ATPase
METIENLSLLISIIRKQQKEEEEQEEKRHARKIICRFLGLRSARIIQYKFETIEEKKYKKHKTFINLLSVYFYRNKDTQIGDGER